MSRSVQVQKKLWIGAAVAGLVAAGLLWLAWPKLPWASPSSQSLNVLLITLDTTRADSLECYGHPTVKTPHINALARDGVLFEQCTTSAPVTLPAHASLMTATEPFVHGSRNNGMVLIDEGNVTLAERLGEAGYTTAARIAAYVLHSDFGIGQGFDDYEGVGQNSEPAGAPTAPGRQPRERPEAAGAAFADGWAAMCRYTERSADAVADSSINWLRERGSSQGSRSQDGAGFFLWIHFYDPHDPMTPPPRFLQRYTDPYLGEIAFVDEQIGRVMAELERLDLDDETLVVLVGDHGEGLGQHEEPSHAYFLYDSTLSVPLIMRVPTLLSRGQRIANQVRLVDVAPTILDLVDLPVLKRGQGTSLVPLMRDGADLNLVAYSETMLPLYDFRFSHLRSLRRGDWKYIHAPRPELYRVTEDSGEINNMAPERPEIVSKMQSLLASIVENAPPPAVIGPGAAAQNLDRDKLMALGYMGGTGATRGTVDERELLPPSGDDPKEHTQEIWFVTHGMAAMRDGKLALALNFYRQALELLPTWTVPKELSALCLSQMGRSAEAIELLLEVIAAFPDSSGTHTRLAVLYAERRERDKARHHYEQSLRLDPTQLEAYKWLAQDSLARGRFAEALERMRQVLGIDPGNVPFLALRAWVLSTCPDDQIRSVAEALELARTACRLSDEQNPLALHSLAAAHAAAGRFDKAVEWAESAAEQATRQGRAGLARQIRSITESHYRQGRPYVDVRR